MAVIATTDRVKKIISLLEKEYPRTRLALESKSPLELLVALILAAQCTDERVNQVTKGLFKKYRSARDYAVANLATLEEEIRPTGFYRNKARSIKACCQAIVESFGGQVPDRLEDLLSLHGVGRKTANILLGNAFGVPAIGVDTHVGRVSQRIGLSKYQDPDKIEEDLCAVVPRQKWVRFCHLLQDHGRKVCVARIPLCYQCVIIKLCDYPDKTLKPIK
ncbi:MAG TPA: endonuclease III [Candidatus Hypogeohydataceae bacterium YC38]|nr:endonuclease III [Candidatus Brocadiales bacterium]